MLPFQGEKQREREHSKHVLAMQGAPMEYERRHWHEMGRVGGIELPACSLELLSWKEAKGNVVRVEGQVGWEMSPSQSLFYSDLEMIIHLWSKLNPEQRLLPLSLCKHICS